MPDLIAPRSFDYSSLDSKTAQFVQQQTSEIKGLFKQTVENIIAVGQRFIEVKEQLPHGQWLDWLVAEFSWTDRTARNYMQVAEQFKLENFSDFDIAASALYLLAAPSTPEEAREEAITRAQAGERITVAAARDLRDKYISQKPEPELDLLPDLEPEHVPPEPEVKPRLEPYPQRSVQPSVQTIVRLEPKEAIPSKRQRAKEEKSVVVVPKQAFPRTWWKLGESQFLYCGKTTAAEFQKRLPPKVALILQFTSSASEIRTVPFPTDTSSALCYASPYGDNRDFRVLRELIQNALDLETEGGDTIVMLSLPDPAIFILLQQMDVRSFCAEPDPKRCDAAISAWITTRQKAEKMRSQP
ncbi:hypothetical protein AVDCRST_MAG94-4474 [uncultured Leptolyngbya sp.]|uniref:DUF3102 domain-containing protein n=1 Tax=uncultured Leptolyngbya sp. TaxID=332963 RepID=A0A6J4N364_9CYAN|nr:hypothetical protein AVDCRST_MAG94-4474 [uncultured Leptolyngbya sp.]